MQSHRHTHCHFKPFHEQCHCNSQSPPPAMAFPTIGPSRNRMTRLRPLHMALAMSTILFLSSNGKCPPDPVKKKLVRKINFLSCTEVLANCTANCINMRREWPQFDFDFYY